MSIWLDVARIAAGVNVVVLAALGWVWLGNYREHGAAHTLGLLVFAGFLFVENLLWVYLYVGQPTFVGAFYDTGAGIQAGVAMLCGLELVALAVLARITWQ